MRRLQVLFSGSEESDVPGLGLFDAMVKRLPRTPDTKIPHMGWNTATVHKATAISDKQAQVQYFYFIHSYYVPVGDFTMMTCDYGVTFSAAICRDNLVATQFHPEKSGKCGIQLLENFIRGAGA